MSAVDVISPAKVNLGLDILGKRSDGFHEIRTVLAMIDLADHLHVFEDERASNGVVAGVDGPDNLVRKALNAYRARVPESPSLGWSIEKRIPAAAGLGGASSNAAAALLTANALAGTPLDHDELQALAASLGSDIPFFLGGPVALATGRGIDLEPLPIVRGHLLVIVPKLNVEAKTASMYGDLEPTDFTPPPAGDKETPGVAPFDLDRSSLGNAFSRAAARRWAILPALWQILQKYGAFRYALTGAGPATYVLTKDDEASQRLGRAILDAWPTGIDVIASRFRSEPLKVSARSVADG